MKNNVSMQESYFTFKTDAYWLNLINLFWTFWTNTYFSILHIYSAQKGVGNTNFTSHENLSSRKDMYSPMSIIFHLAGMIAFRHGQGRVAAWQCPGLVSQRQQSNSSHSERGVSGFRERTLRSRLLLEFDVACRCTHTHWTIRKDNKPQVWSRCFVLRSCRLFPMNREVSLWRPWW